MYEFTKEHIPVIACILFAMNFISGLYTGISVNDLIPNLILILFVIFVFVINDIILNKGRISDKDVGTLFFILITGFIFCIKSFINKSKGSASLSISTNIIFTTNFLLFKIFDIKIY